MTDRFFLEQMWIGAFIKGRESAGVVSEDDVAIHCTDAFDHWLATCPFASKPALTAAPARAAEPEEPCPVCGCEERGQGGYLSCECPAPASPASVTKSVAWRWKWTDGSTWMVSISEPDAHPNRIIEPLYSGPGVTP